MSLLQKCARCGTFGSAGASDGLCESCRAASGDPATRLDEAPGPDRTVRIEAEIAGIETDCASHFHFKNYDLLSEIARGGMGIVFKARQINLNRIVAVKVIRAGPSAGSAEIQRFLIEARAAATLQHSNIVAIHEIGVESGQHFFSMDFVEGRNLNEILKERTFSQRDAAILVKQIAEAIHYAHQRGILHRDLKPSNVLIDRHDQPRVTDFGLAKLMADDSEVTISGTILGSPNYMPPEQAEGRTNDITVRSDIYSLGAILYHLLTDAPPFAGDSPFAIMKLVVEADPVAPRHLNPKIARDLETICLKCLEKNPSARFGTASEVAEELDRFLNYRPIRARSLNPFERAWRWCRRKPAVAAALFIFVCGFIGVFWQWRRAEALALNESVLRHRAEQASVVSLLAQARVMRASGVAGQRHRSLAALEQATRLQPSAELRDEILACLPLVDLRLARESSPDLKPSTVLAFDRSLSRYAHLETGDQIAISAVGSDDPLAILPGTGKSPTQLQFSPNGQLLAAASDGSFTVWDVSSQRPLMQMSHLQNSVVVDFSPDNTRLMAGDGSGQIQIFDLASSRVESSFGVGRPCSALRFGPGGHRVAVSSRESLNLFVFDAATGEEINKMPHPAILHDICWHPSGDFIAAACADNQIYVWNSKSGERTVLRGHTAPPRQICFANGGTFLASISEDKTIRIWDTVTGHPLVRWDGAASKVLSFSRDDRMLACNIVEATGSKIEFLEVTWPEDVRSFPQIRSEPDISGPGAIAENGRLLISPVEEGIELWDIVSGTRLESLRLGRVQAAALGRGGKDLFVRSFYGLHRFPVAYVQARQHLMLLGPPIFFDFAPSDGGMALVGEDKLAFCDASAITLISTESGTVLRRFDARGGFKNVAATADGNWLAAANWESGDVAVRHTITTNQVDLSLGTRAFIAFSPDSLFLATSTDLECRLWSVGEWKSRRTLRRRLAGSRPAPIAFSPDSSILAWASSDNVVTLTAVATARNFLNLPSPGASPITSVQFTPDGGGLMIATEGQPVTIWDLGAIDQRLIRYGLKVEAPRRLPHWSVSSNSPAPRVLVNVAKIEHTQRARNDLHERRTALAQDTNDFAAWREIGAIDSAFFHFAAAVDAYREALRIDPQNSSCAMETGYALVKLKRFHEAAELYQQLLVYDPRNVTACQQLAYIFLHAAKSREIETGAAFAQRAFDIDSSDPSSLFWLGVAEYRSGRFKEALDLLDRSLAANPSSLSAPFYRAMCFAKMGNSAKARETLKAALDQLEANPASFVEHREHFQTYINEASEVCAKSEKQ